MPYWWSQSFDENDPQSSAWLNAPDFDSIYASENATNAVNSGKGNFFEFSNPKSLERKAYFESNVDLLNVMVTISPKMAVSLGVKNRTFFNIDHLSQS